MLLTWRVVKIEVLNSRVLLCVFKSLTTVQLNAELLGLPLLLGPVTVLGGYYLRPLLQIGA